MDNKPEMDERIRGFKGYGLIQLIHGTGKGKTTSALGQAIRCAGSDRRVLIIYFDKGGTSHYYERKLLDKIAGIDYVATGRDRIDPESGKFDFSITDVDREQALLGLSCAQEAFLSNEYQLIILDEINSTVDLGMLQVEDVLNILDAKQPNIEVILTGRNPHEQLKKRAHLISEVRMEKHYFYSGVPAREGLDY